MSRFLAVITVIILIGIGIGFYFRWQEDYLTGDRIIGICVLASSFILLPLFLYHRWKGKKLKDYTLSEENMKKMKDRKNR